MSVVVMLFFLCAALLLIAGMLFRVCCLSGMYDGSCLAYDHLFGIEGAGLFVFLLVYNV